MLARAMQNALQSPVGLAPHSLRSAPTTSERSKIAVQKPQSHRRNSSQPNSLTSSRVPPIAIRPQNSRDPARQPSVRQLALHLIHVEQGVPVRSALKSVGVALQSPTTKTKRGARSTALATGMAAVNLLALNYLRTTSSHTESANPQSLPMQQQ